MTEHDNADRQQRYADAAGLLPALTRPETIGGAWAKERLAAVMALADEEIRAALDPASLTTRPSPAPADDERTRTGAAPSEGHSEARSACTCMAGTPLVGPGVGHEIGCGS